MRYDPAMTPDMAPARSGAVRLIGYCVWVAVVGFLFWPAVITVPAGLIASAITGVSPFTPPPSGRFREVWRMKSGPADDSALRTWLERNRALRGPVKVKRNGELITAEYDRTESGGPPTPPWESLGYRSAGLESVERIGDARPATGKVEDAPQKPFLVIGMTLGALIGALMLNRKQDRAWSSWRGPSPGRTAPVAMVGAGWGMVVAMLMFLYEFVAGRLGFNVEMPALLSGMSATQLAFALPGIVVFGPIAEEILCRGLMFGRCWREGRPWLGAIVSSVIFAVGHTNVVLFPLFLAGALGGCWLFRRTGDLLAPISAHVVLNIVGVYLVQLWR